MTVTVAFVDPCLEHYLRMYLDMPYLYPFEKNIQDMKYNTHTINLVFGLSTVQVFGVHVAAEICRVLPLGNAVHSYAPNTKLVQLLLIWKASFNGYLLRETHIHLWL